jgi:hypothetical protein
MTGNCGYTDKIKLSVVSQQGKEAVIAVLEKGSFSGKSTSPSKRDVACHLNP